jgi:hypothetical protein
MESIIKELERLSNGDELFMQYQITPGEATIVGTKKAYINAALKLLKIADALPEEALFEDEIETITVKCTNSIKHVFNETGDVWPIASYLVKNNNQARLLAKYLGS